MPVLLPLLASPALAEEPAQIYATRCVSCHQADGSGNPAMKAPVIAGQDPAYLSRQLTRLRDGQRSIEGEPLAQTMVALLKPLKDEEIAALSAYVGALPAPVLEQGAGPPNFRARGLYSGCSSCHGTQGEGFPALGAPRIAGQYDWYLKAQLEGFREGRRGADPEDTLGQQMQPMAQAIASDADLDVLVSYIAGMKP